MTPEQWVALACGKPGTSSKFTIYIHVVNGVAHATDAKRMHWCCTQFPDGMYCPETYMPVIFKGFVVDWASLYIDFTKAKAFSFDNMRTGYQSVPGLEFRQAPNNGTAVRTPHILEALNGDTSTLLYDDGIATGKISGVNSLGGGFVLSGLRIKNSPV